MSGIISHRGNLDGPIPERENSPDYIDQAIKWGFVVEIDIRYKGGKLWLGHDYAQWPVEIEWLEQRHPNLLVHIKDWDVLTQTQVWHKFHSFCHVGDPFTVTSHGLLWIHDLSLPYTQESIIPLITQQQVVDYNNAPRKTPGHICTDHPVMFL